MKPYTSPILAGIFQLLGILSTAAGVFYIAATMAKGGSISLATAFSAVIGGIVTSSMGNALEYLARGAYWAEYQARQAFAQHVAEKKQGSAYGRM